MNPFAHLIAFDVRRLWKQTLVLLVVQLAVTLNSLQPDINPDVQSFLKLGLTFLLSAFWISLVASIAQSYPAFAPNAFWTTRPISAVRLVTTRIVSALLLVIALPALLHLIVLICLGLTPGAAIDACAGVACALALCVAPLLVLATLAGKFLRFWLLLFAGVTLLSLSTSSLASRFPDAAPENTTSRAALCCLLTVIACVGILWRAYTRRSLPRSVAHTCVLCAGIVTLALTWRWQLPFLKDEDIPEISAPAGFTLTPQKLVTTMQSRRDGRLITLAGDFTAPAASMIGPSRITHLSGQLHSDGSVRAHTRLKLPLEEAPAIEALLGADVRLPDGFRRLSFSFGTNLKTPARPTTFSGQVRVERLHTEKIAELPLRVGERLRRGSAQIAIVSMNPAPHGHVELTLARQLPHRTFTDASLSETAIRDGIIVLLNRRLKQGVLLHSSDFTTTENIRVLGIQRDRLTITVPLPVTSAADTQTWVTDATLCLIAQRPENFFQVPITFPIPPPTR